MYLLLNDLANKIYTLPLMGKIMLILAYWICVWPGLMFWVGLICESRRVPFWHNQSKAFMPGDLMLVVMLFALNDLHRATNPNHWGYSLFWWLPLTVVMLVVFYFIRKADIANYPPRSRVSPTKILHDVVGYFYFPWILVGVGAPMLIPAIKSWQIYWPALTVFGFSLIFYVICCIVDTRSGFTKEQVLARHPADWKPIWR